MGWEPIKNQKGFGLLEVMISVGIMGALMASMMTYNEYSQKSITSMRASSDFDSAINSLRLMASKTNICRNIIGNPITGNGPSQTLTIHPTLHTAELVLYNISGSGIAFQAGHEAAGQFRVEHVEYTLAPGSPTPATPPSTDLIYNGNLKIKGRKGRQAGANLFGNQILESENITLEITTDSSGLIVGCQGGTTQELTEEEACNALHGHWRTTPAPPHCNLREPHAEICPGGPNCTGTPGPLQGHWTVPDNTYFVKITLVGGGGGGGSATDGNGNPGACGSGGGGGSGFVTQVDLPVTPGQTLSYTLGAGGDSPALCSGGIADQGGNGGTSTIATHITARGGSGGMGGRKDHYGGSGGLGMYPGKPGTIYNDPSSMGGDGGGYFTFPFTDGIVGPLRYMGGVGGRPSTAFPPIPAHPDGENGATGELGSGGGGGGCGDNGGGPNIPCWGGASGRGGRGGNGFVFFQYEN